MMKTIPTFFPSLPFGVDDHRGSTPSSEASRRQRCGGATVPHPRARGTSEPEASAAPRGHGGPWSTAPSSCACTASSRATMARRRSPWRSHATLHLFHRGHGDAPPRLLSCHAKAVARARGVRGSKQGGKARVGGTPAGGGPVAAEGLHRGGGGPE
jgi:hypothetical protein